MPSFRIQRETAPQTSLCSPGLEQVRSIIADALRPNHFFLLKPLTLEPEHAATEEIFWEIFHGRLLDRPLTMCRQNFEAWNLFLVNAQGRSAEPLLSLKLDPAAGQLHVTRSIHCHVWEAYESSDNVILSRETQKWVRELVGTISVDAFDSRGALRDEIICRVFQAIVGTNRLPLTSEESPLPQFSLGMLAYFYCSSADPESGPLRSYQDLIERGLTDQLAWVEKAKLLETLLHAVPYEEMGNAADLLAARMGAPDLLALLRTLFNEVALSPYTDLVDKTLGFLGMLEERRHLTTSDIVDFLGYLLRQQGRHLTAYDLVTFHHRGANYPDALLLDAVLKAFLKIAECQPGLFLTAAGDAASEQKTKRMRRRALRHGWLLRRRYEGHRVPDEPTSQGENLRVLPAPHQRIPEEQITNPQQRSKRLFSGDPLENWTSPATRTILAESIRDLQDPVELRELGMALFLDRPLGAGKAPLERDQTLLLSYVAFSRSIARQRLRFLAEDLGLIPDRVAYDGCRGLLDDLPVPGLALDAVPGTARAGGVSLVDAGKAASDFLFLWTTSQTVQAFEKLYDFSPLLERFALQNFIGSKRKLIVRSRSSTGQSAACLAIYDDQMHKRLEIDYDPGQGYFSRGGEEYPRSPLRVRQVWEGTREHDVSGERILLTMV